VFPRHIPDDHPVEQPVPQTIRQHPVEQIGLAGGHVKQQILCRHGQYGSAVVSALAGKGPAQLRVVAEPPGPGIRRCVEIAPIKQRPGPFCRIVRTGRSTEEQLQRFFEIVAQERATHPGGVPSQPEPLIAEIVGNSLLFECHKQLRHHLPCGRRHVPQPDQEPVPPQVSHFQFIPMTAHVQDADAVQVQLADTLRITVLQAQPLTGHRPGVLLAGNTDGRRLHAQGRSDPCNGAVGGHARLLHHEIHMIAVSTGRIGRYFFHFEVARTLLQHGPDGLPRIRQIRKPSGPLAASGRSAGFLYLFHVVRPSSGPAFEKRIISIVGHFG